MHQYSAGAVAGTVWEDSMQRMILAIAAATLCAGAAHAADRDDAAKASSAAATKAQQHETVSRDTRVCVRIEPVTGSRLRRTICRKYGEWLKRGIDPLADE
ncbi:hypothetical protein [Stakelama saccharophila]|uniref:UrcA family protein n=1 Tax=Stakelama saccharophila TaxID=3075605 RepID=A0ABZ0BDE8_9SPHN|nr:hypothetical protein [Stakelama sp. W311]WNO54923.1 hypothetical protein RPR59_06665 [Stakelama sp. W311]